MPMIPYWRILRRLCPSVSRPEQGVGLIEVLIGIVLVTVASLATLSYYSYGMGGVGKQENRRAALEIARQRLDQLMAATLTNIAGSDPTDPNYGKLHWLTLDCSTNPCTWGRTADTGTPGNPVPVPEPGGVLVNQLQNQRMQTTVQRIHDTAAGTSATTLDTVELSVKVWFTTNTNPVTDDNNSNRVHIRTLRT